MVLRAATFRLFPYTTLFRSEYQIEIEFWDALRGAVKKLSITRMDACETCHGTGAVGSPQTCPTRSEETRLNSSHANISYAVFCLKKKRIWPSIHHCIRHGTE